MNEFTWGHTDFRLSECSRSRIAHAYHMNKKLLPFTKSVDAFLFRTAIKIIFFLLFFILLSSARPTNASLTEKG